MPSLETKFASSILQMVVALSIWLGATPFSHAQTFWNQSVDSLELEAFKACFSKLRGHKPQNSTGRSSTPALASVDLAASFCAAMHPLAKKQYPKILPLAKQPQALTEWRLVLSLLQTFEPDWRSQLPTEIEAWLKTIHQTVWFPQQIESLGKTCLQNNPQNNQNRWRLLWSALNAWPTDVSWGRVVGAMPSIVESHVLHRGSLHLRFSNAHIEEDFVLVLVHELSHLNTKAATLRSTPAEELTEEDWLSVFVFEEGRAQWIASMATTLLPLAFEWSGNHALDAQNPPPYLCSKIVDVVSVEPNWKQIQKFSRALQRILPNPQNKQLWDFLEHESVLLYW